MFVSRGVIYVPVHGVIINGGAAEVSDQSSENFRD